MKSVRFLAFAAIVGATAVTASPSWAMTAYQHWAQGQGVYVPSTAHPPGGLSDIFGYVTDAPLPPPGYPYAPPPPAYPYGYAPY